MSPLVAEWVERAREDAEATSLDRLVYTEARDPAVSFSRMVVTGGVVDGRKHRPGVLLYTLTSDGYWQALGVSSEEAALSVLEALRMAWPGLAVSR